MSVRHPLIAVTGSSGAGTSSTRPLFARLFGAHGLRAAFVDGDSFHAYDREQMQAVLERARIRGENFSHFGPAANLWDRLEQLFRGVRRARHGPRAGVPPWRARTPQA